jgi:hypothetical protein
MVAAWEHGRSFRVWGGRGEVSHLYRGVSRVFLGIRVGPQINRLEGDNGSVKKRGQTS